jgi:hypothetical protein
VDDSAVRESLVTKGLERAKMFNWDKTAAETCRVYQEVHQ